MTRPDPFSYHDVSKFLGDFLNYMKAEDDSCTQNKIATSAALSAGFLSDVIHGSRKISVGKSKELFRFLPLSKTESSYLEQLCRLQISTDNKIKEDALKNLNRFHKYADMNPNEANMYRYFSKWYHAAIRELAGTKGFQLDPKWIQSRLKKTVAIPKIKSAIEFLFEAGFIELDKNGRCRSSNREIHGHQSVLRPALIQHHGQMFDLAKESLETTDGKLREVHGYTLAMPLSKLEEAKQIVRKAVEELAKLSGDGATADSVYQMSVALFPMTRGEKKNE